MDDITHIVGTITGWVRDGRRLLLLSDYDGTLTPIVPIPAEAWLSGGVRDDLQALARSPWLRVGVVSGRDLADVRARVGVAGAIYAGCHGLEVDGGGLRFAHPEAEAQREIIAGITGQLTGRASGVPGMLVEPKRFGVAVHYRQVAADRVGQVDREIARAIRQDRARIKVFHGEKVIEIQPQVRWNKGDCVAWIREAIGRAPGGPLMLLYMGDDWTDEHVFESLVGHIITIRVGSAVPASRAVFRVADVADIQRLLHTLASALS